MMKIRTYSELVIFPTFEERFDYLKLGGAVAEETFGFERYLNQTFYKLREWKSIRDYVILRDQGRDLGVEGYDIFGKVLIHHMNPISRIDLETMSDRLLNPEYLICTSHLTHNAIHYGSSDILPKEPVTRFKNDTCPWKL